MTTSTIDIKQKPQLQECMVELYTNLISELALDNKTGSFWTLIDDKLINNEITITIGTHLTYLPVYITDIFYYRLGFQYKLSCIVINGIKYNVVKGIFDFNSKPFKNVYVFKIELYNKQT